MKPLMFIEYGTKRVVVDIPGPCSVDGISHAVAYVSDSAHGSDIQCIPLGRYVTLDWVEIGHLFIFDPNAEYTDLYDKWHAMYEVPAMACCYPKAEILMRIRAIAMFLNEDGYGDIPDITLIADYLHMTDKPLEGQLTDEGPDWDTRDREGYSDEVPVLDESEIAGIADQMNKEGYSDLLVTAPESYYTD